MRNWRDDPMTDGQKKMIEQMGKDAEMNGAVPLPEFKGATKGEACDYIQRHIVSIHINETGENEDAGDRV